MDIGKIVTQIQPKIIPNQTFIIAIDGRSGSGKSTLAKQLQKELKDSKIIHLDEFDLYAGQKSRQRVIKEILQPQKDLNNNSIIIIEGIFTLHSDLINYYDYKIWIECPTEIGFKRGLKRDINLNGIDNSDNWTNYWLPIEEEYVTKQKPQQRADIVIDGTI